MALLLFGQRGRGSRHLQRQPQRKGLEVDGGPATVAWTPWRTRRAKGRRPGEAQLQWWPRPHPWNDGRGATLCQAPECPGSHTGHWHHLRAMSVHKTGALSASGAGEASGSCLAAGSRSAVPRTRRAPRCEAEVPGGRGEPYQCPCGWPRVTQSPHMTVQTALAKTHRPAAENRRVPRPWRPGR